MRDAVMSERNSATRSGSAGIALASLAAAQASQTCQSLPYARQVRSALLARACWAMRSRRSVEGRPATLVVTRSLISGPPTDALDNPFLIGRNPHVGSWMVEIACPYSRTPSGSQRHRPYACSRGVFRRPVGGFWVFLGFFD